MWLPPILHALSRRVFPDPGRRAVALKAVSFAMVGVINASVDFGLFYFFRFRVGLPTIVSNLISWSVAVTGSYVMNSMITFAAESGGKLRFKSYTTFLLAQVAGLIANTATVQFVPVLLGLIPGIEQNSILLLLRGALGMDHDSVLILVGKLLAIGVSFVVNFSLSHFVVFRRREQPTTH